MQNKPISLKPFLFYKIFLALPYFIIYIMYTTTTKELPLKVPESERQNIIRDYTEFYVPMAEIATRYKVTRMAIWKILHRSGIDTTKEAANIKTTCTNCNTPIIKKRCQIRKSHHHFCSHSCFSKWLNRKDPVNPLITHRHGLRIARKIVSEYFIIPPGAVVHHEDRNQNNNDPTNLRVFSSTSDHIKYHRDQNITPIWSGKTQLIKLPKPEYIS